jgi:hypothetical protein
MSHFKQIKNLFQKFKNKISKTKNEPRSKRKSLLLGSTTVLGIFGLSLFSSVLPVLAKEIPKNSLVGGTPRPAPKQAPPLLITNVPGTAATVYALAITSGSFVVGGACGIIVVIGILKAQGK